MIRDPGEWVRSICDINRNVDVQGWNQKGDEAPAVWSLKLQNEKRHSVGNHTIQKRAKETQYLTDRG